MANGIREAFSRNLTFWGMVGVVMTALKLKEHVDGYNEVPREEDGLGPVALRSSSGNFAEDATVEDGLLDTGIPGAHRPKRARRCCGCCGARCGLFWKAFGIVCLIFVVWQSIKLIFWAATPSPTGLEDMPEFSTSLGCSNAPFLFGSVNQTYTVPMGTTKGDHSMDISGGAVGTITLAQGAPESTDIIYKITVRTEDEALLEKVSVQYPSADDISEGLSSSRLLLSTPRGSACMRYDITLFVPEQLKKLHVQSHAVSHVQFHASSTISLDKLFVTLYTTDVRNMLFVHEGVQAKSMQLELTRGWLVGDVALVQSAAITTQRGDAVANVHVKPTHLEDGETPMRASLQTTTGAGRTNIFYENHKGFPHRPIISTHRSSRNGDLYLTYKDAEFNGRVDMDAKSYSARGLHGSIGRGANAELPWAGDKDGVDKLEITSPKGWVGLYF